MSKKNRPSERIDFSQETKGFSHNPFAALAKAGAPSEADAGATLAETPAPSKASAPSDTVGEFAEFAKLPKLVVRREKKGRAGKTVTVVEGLASLEEAARESIARQVRKALGTGTSLEGPVVVVQGDIGERVAQWLTGQGVRQVVRGN